VRTAIVGQRHDLLARAQLQHDCDVMGIVGAEENATIGYGVGRDKESSHAAPRRQTRATHSD